MFIDAEDDRDAQGTSSRMQQGSRDPRSTTSLHQPRSTPRSTPRSPTAPNWPSLGYPTVSI